MPKKRQTFSTYTVIITRYANEAMRERFEHREPLIADFAALVSEFVYMGSSEARARSAYFSAARRAQKDALVMNVTVWQDSQVLIRSRPV